MNYPIEQANKEIDGINDELKTIRIKKGHDYSGTKDTLDNLRDFGLFGVVMRIGDKYKRLKHFCLQKELAVEDESIEDTIKDLVNYGLFALILHRQSKPKKGGDEICRNCGKPKSHHLPECEIAPENTMETMNDKLGEL